MTKSLQPFTDRRAARGLDRASRSPYNSNMRRIVWVVGGLAVALAAAYSGYWYTVAGKIRDRMAPWVASRQAEGVTIKWDSVAIGGFPLAIRLRFANFDAAAAKPLPYVMSAADISFWSRPWDLRQWHFSAPDGARVEFLLASAGFDAKALDGTVTVPLQPGGTADIEAQGVDGRGAAQGIGLDSVHVAVQQPPTPPKTDHDPALLVNFDIKGARLRAAPAPFGTTIQDISATATIDGTMAPAPLPQMLDAWRRAGGAIELESAHLAWDKLDIDANGTLALDDDLQPLAALTATVRGQNEIVDAAVGSGAMPEGDAGLARAVLAMISQQGDDGRKQIRLPISAQNRRLYLGPAAIARIPTIDWR
ncbi:MAG: DUF2125 domain-containing protein [Alphaproteobacteria bacterium]|nr:DUF2125 domain-containing protein [Alphaproteobacteria bacterium]